MERITISVPDGTAEKAERQATKQRRSVSAYVSLLIEQDLRDAGLAEGDQSAEVIAQLAERLPKRPLLLKSVKRLLKRDQREQATTVPMGA